MQLLSSRISNGIFAMGKGRKEAARDGTKEISGAIIASTLTTLAVFVPVIFISGLIGQIFTEFALTISFSLFASLVVALTVVPMMASRMLNKPQKNIEARRRRSKSLNSFERSVRWSLRHRAVVLLLTLSFLSEAVSVYSESALNSFRQRTRASSVFLLRCQMVLHFYQQMKW